MGMMSVTSTPSRRPTTTASSMKTAIALSIALPAPAGLKTVPWASVMEKMRMAHGGMEPSVLPKWHNSDPSTTSCFRHLLRRLHFHHLAYFNRALTFVSTSTIPLYLYLFFKTAQSFILRDETVRIQG